MTRSTKPSTTSWGVGRRQVGNCLLLEICREILSHPIYYYYYYYFLSMYLCKLNCILKIEIFEEAKKKMTDRPTATTQTSVTLCCAAPIPFFLLSSRWYRNIDFQITTKFFQIDLISWCTILTNLQTLHARVIFDCIM